jgi:dolichol-phosphate mannosyltransferase
MADLIKLTVVLPALQEAANLKKLLPALRAVLETFNVAYEVVVIDGELPTDETPQVCIENAVSCINRAGGALYSDAVKTGIRHARGEYILFMDADGSHNPGSIPALWEQCPTADLIIASRYVPGGATENPAILILMSRIVNIVFRLALQLNVCDVSNSFRLYRGQHLKQLDLQCEHFDIVEEILVKLCTEHPDYLVKEVPITFERRKAGKTKRDLVAFAIGYVTTLRRLRKIKREAMRGRRL